MRTGPMFCLFALTAAGCNQPRTDAVDWTPLIATSLMSKSLAAERAPTPPGGACRNCNGRGQVGDGVVAITCPVCQGAGRTAPAAQSKSGGAPTAPRSDCASGMCFAPSVRRTTPTAPSTASTSRTRCFSQTPQRRLFRHGFGWRLFRRR
jgi:hypothetical protein